MQTLRDALIAWTDFDIAAHRLGQALGVLSAELEMRDAKQVYWSTNPLGDTLHGILNELVDVGILEKRGEPNLQYRWSADFTKRYG